MTATPEWLHSYVMAKPHDLDRGQYAVIFELTFGRARLAVMDEWGLAGDFY